MSDNLAKDAHDDPHMDRWVTMAGAITEQLSIPVGRRALVVEFTLEEARAIFKPRPQMCSPSFERLAGVEVLHHRVYDAAAKAGFDMSRFVRDR